MKKTKYSLNSFFSNNRDLALFFILISSFYIGRFIYLQLRYLCTLSV